MAVRTGNPTCRDDSGNQLLLGGVTRLSSQCDTTQENHIAFFGRENSETDTQAVDCFIEFRLRMTLDFDS
jgi:hypothetical protein